MILIIACFGAVSSIVFGLGATAAYLDRVRGDKRGHHATLIDCPTDHSPTLGNELGQLARERPPICTLVHYRDPNGLGTLYTTPQSIQRMAHCRGRIPRI